MAEANLREIVERARTAQGSQLDNLLYHRSKEVLEALLDNPRLGEQHLTIMLARKDLSREVVTAIAQNQEWMRSYPLKVAVLKHPRTPRHVALRLIKFIYPFDLLGIGMAPGVAPELKRLMEDTLLAQREGMAAGQRLTLARRGTSRIAGGLLNDPDGRVVRAALDNPAVTEQAVAAALLADRSSEELPTAVSQHPRWAARRGVRLALLRSKHTSLARIAAILPELTLAELSDLGEDPRIAANLRSYVAVLVRTRKTRPRRKSV